MKFIKALLFSLMFVSVANAGTVTVNGSSCGSLVNGSLSASGDVVLNTNSSCGTGGTPSPNPSPNPTPNPNPYLPAGCSLPTIGTLKMIPTPTQLTVLNGPKDTIWSFKLQNVDQGVWSMVKNNSYNSGRMSAVISECPGDISATGKNRNCYSYSGVETSSIFYGTKDGYRCVLDPAKTYYYNATFLTPSGRNGCNATECGFTLK